MQLKITTPVPSSRFSLSKKLKSNSIHIRGASQTPTLRKKFSPHLNKSFNCYEEASVLPNYSRNSPSILRETLVMKKTKNRLRVSPKLSSANALSLAKREMSGKNYRKALDLLNRVIHEDSSQDGKYYRGVCLMHMKQYNEALSDLNFIKETSPLYDPQLYIALYMCHMYLNDYSSAIKSLSICVKLFPGHSKAFLLRGQMLNKMKKYEKAIRDFKKVDENEACLYVAQSFKGLRQYQRALGFLEKAVKCEMFKDIALLEKIKVLYKLGLINEAKEIIARFDEVPRKEVSLQVAYYESKIKIREGDYSEAALLLEEVTQYSTDPQISLRAICKIALIMLKERDYYGALHTFQRARGKLYSKNKKSLQEYTEAVVSLMKRKYSEGIKLLSNLLKEGLKDYQTNCYIFRAYGFYASGHFTESIEDYTTASQSQVLDKASEFNFSISKGIILSKTSSKSALKHFKSLQSSFPKNPVAEICQVCLLLDKSITDSKILQKAEKLMIRAANKRTDSEVLYIKSMIFYFQGDFEKAFSNIKECIDKAEENIFCHYLLRGFCNLALKIYQEAVQDFSISIQLNDSVKALYPYRGICGYLSEDYNLALDDFLYYSNDGRASSVVLSAKLLLFTACYTDALMLLSNSEDSEDTLKLKAYCYLMTEMPEKSLNCLEKIENPFCKNDSAYIKKLCQGQVDFFGEGEIFTKKYALWMQGLQMMYSGNYLQAIEVFQDVLEIMHNNENDLFNDNIIIEEENCEVLYNIALCNTLNEQLFNREHALLILKELAEVVNIEHRGQLCLICAVIELCENNKESAEKFLKESAKCAPDHCQKFIEGLVVDVLPLHTANEFSQRFPLIEIPGNRKVRLRPAVTLPKVPPPLGFGDSCTVVKELLALSTVQPRPEAPWLNRSKGSIQFTDSIIDLEIDESKKHSKNIAFVPKQCKSQEIRKKNSSFVKIKEMQKENSKINQLFNKIKEICS
jgi:predicted Zn-dependent protease